MDFCFSKRELSFLDDLMPESKKKKLDDAKNEAKEEEVRPGAGSVLWAVRFPIPVTAHPKIMELWDDGRGWVGRDIKSIQCHLCWDSPMIPGCSKLIQPGLGNFQAGGRDGESTTSLGNNFWGNTRTESNRSDGLDPTF